MLERVILHVGPHKTGSTALQMAFRANLDRLARYGIYYPETGRTGPAHQDVARACWEKDSPLLPALADEVRGHRMAFLSSEMFSALGEPGLQRLRGAFGVAEVEIVYLLRRLPLLLPSHWRELVKHGQPLGFDVYMDLARETAPRQYLSPPMPAKQLARIAAVFGADALRLLVYDVRADEIGAYGPGFVDDVFGIGQEAERFGTGRFNTSAPHWQTELVRHLNILAGSDLSYSAKWEMRGALVARIASDPPGWLDAFRALYGAAVSVRLSDETPFIADEQAEVVARYCDQFIDPPESYTAPVSTEVRALDPAALPDDMARALRTLFSGLRAGLSQG